MNNQFIHERIILKRNYTINRIKISNNKVI